MKRQNRNTLRKRFGDGEVPTSTDFSDLITSAMNIQDDGIEHNAEDGLRLTQIASSNRILSFYAAMDQTSAVWGLGLDTVRERGRLTLDVAPPGERRGTGTGGGTAVLTLLADDGAAPPRVGVCNTAPRHTLDVAGTIAASGRVGAHGKFTALADGNWHTISEPYNGCTALEVVAGAGKKNAGRYALMHALALRTFDAKGDFTYHQAHYGTRRNRLRLQWASAGKDDKDFYVLQIRVDCDYGDEVPIQYYLTNLWFDPAMDCNSAGDS